jgi:hypothetical protein
MGTPVRVTTPPNPANTTCFKYGELGHYANMCPQRQPRVPECRISGEGMAIRPHKLTRDNRGTHVARWTMLMLKQLRRIPKLCLVCS